MGSHETIACPFSLNQYAEEVVRQNRSGDAMMNFEWTRYMSFKTFPQESIMTPMRLSLAGFFYTGRGEEVKCFCCGVINDQWPGEETARQVHARLSPNCAYINNQDTDNVPIHCSEYYQRGFQPHEDGRQAVARIEPQTGSSGGPSDRFYYTSHLSRDQSARINGCDESFPLAAVSNRSEAKNPEYERFETRLDTFSKWTLHDIQDPREMAETGLVYTHVRDFVRCYHCGIGLKNWEREDDPQEEHKRWSPSCGFLLQNSSQASAHTTGTTRPGVTQNSQYATRCLSAPDMLLAFWSLDDNRPVFLTCENNDQRILEVMRAKERDLMTQREVNKTLDEQILATKAANDRAIKAHRRDIANLKKSITELKERNMCKVCLDIDNEATIVLLPCGHLIACRRCAPLLTTCCICRSVIENRIRIYQS